MDSINDNVFQQQQNEEDVNEILHKTAKSAVSLIPIVGTSIQEFIVDPIFAEQAPNTLADSVKQDIININSMYNADGLTDYEYTKRITNTLFDDRIPTDLKVKYIPHALDITNERITSSNKYFANSIQNLDQSTKKQFVQIGKTLSEESARLTEIKETLNNTVTKQQLQTAHNEILKSFDNLDQVVTKQLEPIITDTNKLCQRTANLNTSIIRDWADNSIVGFENDDKAVGLKVALDRAIEPEDIIRLSSDLKNHKTKIMCDRHEFEKTVQTTQSAVQGAALVAAFMGDKRTARRIQVVGSAAITIGTNIAGLCGYGMLASCVTPFTAAVAIGACIYNVIEEYNSSDDSGMQEVFEQLFEQLSTIRKEMHERFDQLDNKIDKLFDTTLRGLTNLQNSVNFTNQEVILLHGKVDKMDTDIKHNFCEISQQITDLYRLIKASKHNKVLDVLTQKLYTYCNEVEPDTDAFPERAKALEAYIKLVSSKYTSEDFPSTVYPINPTDYDFSLNLLLKHDNPPINPTIYTMTALSTLLLTIRQYPSINAPRLSRIAVQDVNRLHEIVKQGHKLIDEIESMKSGTKLEDLVEPYVDAIMKCRESIQKFTDKFEETIADNYNKYSLETHISKYNNLSDIELFKKPINVTTNPPGGNWYCSGWTRETHKKGVCMQGIDPSLGVRCRSDKQSSMKQIEVAKDNYIQTRKTNSRIVYKNKFGDISNKVEVVDMEFPWFIHPEEAGNPLLPVADEFNKCIPTCVMELCCRNMGHLRYVYRVEEDKFMVNLMLIMGSDTTLIGTIELEYNPGIFVGPEAIWWYFVGGHYCNQKTVPVIHFNTYQWSAYPNTKYCHGSVPPKAYHEGIMKKLDNMKFTETSNSMINESLVKECMSNEQTYTKQLKVHISNNPLMQVLDHTAKLVIGYMCVTLRDIMNGESILSSFINEYYPVVDTQHILKYAGSNLLNASFWSRVGVDEMVKLYHDYDMNKLYYSTLEFTVDVTIDIIDHYKGHEVRHNRWYRPTVVGEVLDDVLKNTTHTLIDILNIACKEESVKSTVILEKMNDLQATIVETTSEITDDEREYALESLRTICGPNLPLLTN